MAWVLYDNFRLKQVRGSGQITLASITPKVMLVAAGYTPNQNTHDFRDDVTNEVTGTGYTAGGNTLGSPTVTMSGAGLVTFDAADPATWSQNAGGFSNARRAVLYNSRGGAASADELIAYSDDFGSDKGNTTGDLSITLDSLGIFESAR